MRGVRLGSCGDTCACCFGSCSMLVQDQVYHPNRIQGSACGDARYGGEKHLAH